MRNKKVLWITQTAVFIALLITAQYVTKPFGQYVTGSLVNLILAASALTAGLASGLAVALISPFLAFMFGIGPVFIQIVPFVAIGNGALVVTLWLILNKKERPGLILSALSVAAGAIVKFAALWLGVVKIILPLIPGINEKQIQAMTVTFTWPQLITAAIGVSLALAIVPLVNRALNKGRP